MREKKERAERENSEEREDREEDCVFLASEIQPAARPDHLHPGERGRARAQQVLRCRGRGRGPGGLGDLGGGNTTKFLVAGAVWDPSRAARGRDASTPWGRCKYT